MTKRKLLRGFIVTKYRQLCHLKAQRKETALGAVKCTLIPRGWRDGAGERVEQILPGGSCTLKLSLTRSSWRRAQFSISLPKLEQTSQAYNV